MVCKETTARRNDGTTERQNDRTTERKSDGATMRESYSSRPPVLSFVTLGLKILYRRYATPPHCPGLLIYHTVVPHDGTFLPQIQLNDDQ